MLFVVKWTLPIENRVTVWNTLGNMPETEKDKRGDVKLIHRYLKLVGDSGVNVVESDSAEDIMKWAMNWSHLSNITITPVLGESEAYKCMEQSSLVEKKEVSESEYEAPVYNFSDGKMTFVVEYNVPLEANRVDVWNAVANVTPAGHVKSQGNVKLLNRYHYLVGDGGINFVETDSAESLMGWCLNWAHCSNINIYPVIGDAGAMKCMQKSPLFVKKE